MAYDTFLDWRMSQPALDSLPPVCYTSSRTYMQEGKVAWPNRGMTV